ncbi:MAG: universal stress protein [Desulfomicrobiaceae bacterium]|nr:universal stress protein [Desulfomicrobiaceae bacterium]
MEWKRKPIKTILAPLDLSSQAPSVLEEAIHQAKASEAELVLLMVAEDFSDIGDYAHAAQVQTKLLEETQAKAEEYAHHAKAAGLIPQVEVCQSPSPADAILRVAEERHADFIVMGSRSKRGIDRFVLGSVAGKVVSHAPCSVLVVRNP